ncbi:uncharacterized protein [Porites lutea]|uniref:uncharacterized protein isoform X1 n=1 Tax=Porites lutea TaxID=51062 RepID=UPI003CC64B34
MAASQFVFTSFAVLALISPLAFALECYECGPLGSNCSSDRLGKVTCGIYFNRCVTIKYTMDVGFGPMSVQMRNCSNSMACDPQGGLYTCSLVNITGLLTSCELACCQDNLCDPFNPASSTASVPASVTASAGPASAPAPAPSSTPTSASVALVANVCAIFLANLLIIFAWFH